MAIAVTSIIALLVLSVGTSGDVPELVVAVAGASGAAVAGLGAYLTLRRVRYSSYYGVAQYDAIEWDEGVLVSSFLSRWLEVETAMRKTVADHMGESQANAPLSKLIELLNVSGLLAPEDVETLRDLVTTRNDLVHGRAEVDTSHLVRAIRACDEISQRLRRSANALSRDG